MTKKTTKPIAEAESEYSVEEFARAPHVLGDDVTPDIVVAALRHSGVRRTTKSAAQKIIKEFMNKEV